MITHTEDRTKGAARCGETFLGAATEHTCPICRLHTLSSAAIADLAVEALCILSARDDTTEIRLAEVRRIGRMA